MAEQPQIDDFAALRELRDIWRRLEERMEPLDKIASISSTYPITVDYRGRRHLYIFSPVALALQVDSIGTIPIFPGFWTDISFQAGMRLYAQNLANPANVQLRATDEYIPPPAISDIVRLYTPLGKAFSVTTDKQTGPSGTKILGFQLFNKANAALSQLIYSLVLVYNGSAVHQIYLTQADISNITGYSSSPSSIVNNNPASSNASIAVSNFSNSALTGSLVGNAREVASTQNGQPVETFTNGEAVYLPAGANTINGLVVYLTSVGTNGWGITAEYLEF